MSRFWWSRLFIAGSGPFVCWSATRSVPWTFLSCQRAPWTKSPAHSQTNPQHSWHEPVSWCLVSRGFFGWTIRIVGWVKVLRAFMATGRREKTWRTDWSLGLLLRCGPGSLSDCPRLGPRCRASWIIASSSSFWWSAYPRGYSLAGSSAC